MDAASFLKTISESSLYEKELTWAAKSRYSTTSDLFLRQKEKILKSYLNQFETFDHKKKEKNIIGMLNNETNFKQNGLYELFKREGTFYRDTFERLEGFEEFQVNHDPKRSSIHRHKIKSSLEEATAGNHRSAKKAQKNLEERSLTEEGDLSYEATKKILMSPGKVTNQFEVFSAEFMQKLSPISENQEGSRLKKKKNIIPKFQELKKDEVVFKRVLIKNGKYEVSRDTNKSNIV